MEDFLKLCDSVDRTFAEHVRQCLQYGHLGPALNEIQRIAMLRFANAQSIVSERGEPVCVDRDVGVRIIEVVEWQVPVGPSKADAVGQHLDDAGSAICRLTVGSGDVVGARDGSIPQSNQSTFMPLAKATHSFQNLLRIV